MGRIRTLKLQIILENVTKYSVKPVLNHIIHEVM